MGLFNTKVWSWADIWLLKWSAFLFGMVAGAYFADIIWEYALFIAIVAVLVGIRPTIHYFCKSK